MESLFTTYTPFDITVERLVAHGHRKFPARVDYEQIAASLGFDPDAAWSDPGFAAAAMRHWHTSGQSGCLFARILADKASQDRWQSAVLPGETRDALESSILRADGVLRAAIELPECEIVSLLFPGVTGAVELRAVCESLVEHTGIEMSEDRTDDGYALVALRLDISGDGKLAWIMAFGPFASWPPTRRGPVLELAIRVKPKPPKLFHKLNQDPAAAHLADTNPPLSEDQMEKVFERTEMATRDVLGHDPDRRSAAKTTFSFPLREWDQAALPG